MGLVVLGAVTGWVTRSMPGTVLLLAALVVVVVVLVTRSHSLRRASRVRTPAFLRHRWTPLLLFYLGFWPTLWAGDVLYNALEVLGAVAATLLVLLAVRASRRRRAAEACAAHPGAVVVLASVVDLGGMRLAQWSAAVGASLPFMTGSVVLVADDDGLVLERAEASRPLVHRWAWDAVEVSSRDSPEGARLVLTLEGPVNAARSRAVPVAQRRYDVAMTVRTATLAGALGPSTAAASDAADALTAQRRVTSGDST